MLNTSGEGGYLYLVPDLKEKVFVSLMLLTVLPDSSLHSCPLSGWENSLPSLRDFIRKGD